MELETGKKKTKKLNPRNCVLPSTTRPCFTPFYFNAPCQCKPLLNLRSIVSGLTPHWLFFLIYLSHFSYDNIIFELRPFFSEKKTTA
jgi:hypothetical protein